MFIERVLSSKDVDDHPAMRRSAVQYAYQLLGYQLLPNGNAVDIGKEVKTPYGKGLVGDAYDEYEDQYIPDGRKLGQYTIKYMPRTR